MSCYFCGRNENEAQIWSQVHIDNYLAVGVCNTCRDAILKDACRKKFDEEYEKRPKLPVNEVTEAGI